MALDIRLSKAELAEKIKRRLGAPVVKVELEDIQIYDAIDYAKDKWVKWASGNATVETYFTTMLLAGQNFYDVPLGVTEIVDYEDSGRGYGINTLFTVENFLYSQGAYNGLLWNQKGYGSFIVSYHIALDWLKTLKRYTPSIYNYKYHRYTNQLEVHPAPPSGNSLTIGDVTYDSPGFVLVRSYMMEGSHYAGMESDNSQSTWKRTGLRSGSSDTNFYTSDWIFDYAMAECKIMLGRIRVKFSAFASIGNVGIQLDGDQLLQEGIQEKEQLEERLRLEESHEGYGISIG